jgi:hypothetical protein
MTQIGRPASSKLTDDERKTIALQALAGTEPINTLAARNGVSRPTVYRQMNRADVALDELFSSAATRDDKVLFMLPVTARWLESGDTFAHDGRACFVSRHRRTLPGHVRRIDLPGQYPHRSPAGRATRP